MNLEETKAEKLRLDNEIKELYVTRDKLRDIIYEKESLPLLEAQIGSYFVYRDNNYGHGREEDEVWDVFLHATHVENGHLMGIEIFIDCDGKINFEPNSSINSYHASCDAIEYNECLDKIINIISESRK
jgi:hypothetical protein